MFTAGSTTEVGVDQKHFGAFIVRLIERMIRRIPIGVETFIVERKLAEFAEGDSLEKASRNYSVGVDIITVYRDRPAFDFVDA